jgi:hypothetical protein
MQNAVQYLSLYFHLPLGIGRYWKHYLSVTKFPLVLLLLLVLVNYNFIIPSLWIKLWGGTSVN